jgi:raffinose/stachyose/melibiose transport system substrate-binding protein
MLARRGRVALTAFAALVLAGVAACGSSGSSGAGAGTSTGTSAATGASSTGTGAGTSGGAGGSGGSHTLTIWHAYVGQADKVKFMTQTIDAFKKAHPEITLNVVGLEQNAYKTKLQTAMAAHQVPDVFYTLPGGYLDNFVKAGEVYPLDSDLAKNGWGDSFFPTALQQVQFDGKTYAVPVDTDSTVIWYNKALFDSKGWKIPQTWDEFLALCQTIKDAGIAPIALGNKDAWPATFWFQYPVLRMQGPGIIGKFNSGDAGASFGDGGQKALQMMQTLSQKGYFTKGFNGMSDQDANLLFLNSKAAMVLNGTWQIGSSANAPAGFQLGYFPFPTIAGADAAYSNDVIAGVAAAFAISQTSQDKADALTFLQFLTSKEVMTSYVDIRKTMVNVKGATTEAAAGPVLYGIVNDIVGKADALDPFYDTAMPPKAMQTYYNTLQGVLDGSINPDAGAQALQTAMKAQQ